MACFVRVFAVPQHGALKITTEFGKMLVSPHEICVIQVRFAPVLRLEFIFFMWRSLFNALLLLLLFSSVL